MVQTHGFSPLRVSLSGFALNSDRLTIEHSQWVKHYGQAAKRQPVRRGVTVYRIISLFGKACTIGPEAHNVRLAFRRAQNVEKAIDEALQGIHHVVVLFSLGEQGASSLSRAVDIVVEEVTSIDGHKPPPPVTVTPTLVRVTAKKRFKIRITKMNTFDAAVNFRGLQIGGGTNHASFEIEDIVGKKRATYAMSQVSGSVALKDKLPISVSSDRASVSQWVEFTRNLWFPDDKTDVNRFDGYRGDFRNGVFVLSDLPSFKSDPLEFDMRKFYPDADPDLDLKLTGSMSWLGEEFYLVRPGMPI